LNAAFTPAKVFLFSGHMADAPGRALPRLPFDKMPACGRRIHALLDQLGASATDLALTQGSSGGDVLFAEACLARGMRLQLLLPHAEETFIKGSLLVSCHGEQWRERFLALKRHPDTTIEIHAELPAEQQSTGSMATGENAYARCNRWLLARACGFGIDRLRFICLWDGAPGLAGGTAHMRELVLAQGAEGYWIDSRQP
jgi:hypothetical protein